MDEAWRRGPRRGCQRTVTGTALDLALMYKPSTVCTCTRDRAHAVRRWKMPIHVHHPLACQPSMIVCHNFAAGERALNYICHFSVSCASMVINFRKWKITISCRIKLRTFFFFFLSNRSTENDFFFYSPTLRTCIRTFCIFGTFSILRVKMYLFLQRYIF